MEADAEPIDLADVQAFAETVLDSELGVAARRAKDAEPWFALRRALELIAIIVTDVEVTGVERSGGESSKLQTIAAIGVRTAQGEDVRRLQANTEHRRKTLSNHFLRAFILRQCPDWLAILRLKRSQLHTFVITTSAG